MDEELREGIRLLSQNDADYWTFSRKTDREDAHGYYQYPAMMIPRLQRELMKLILQLQPRVSSVFDAFAGSGTILTETMYSGLNARAHDVNPLAVLLCKAKTGPFSYETLASQIDSLVRRISHDQSETPAVEFSGLKKWFTAEAITALSRIHRAITKEPDQWVRRIFWITVAETVRLTSNSRTSTYKLHIRPQSEIDALPDPLVTFLAILERNRKRHASLAETLAAAGLLTNGCYIGDVTCKLHDAREPVDGQFDLLVTSPPYGDNTSTVPYGQNSYLPLQWIDPKDLPSPAESDYLKSTYEIDNLCLGGTLPRGDLWELSSGLRKRSPSLERTLKALLLLPRDRSARVYAFVRDLDQCLTPLARSIRKNGYLLVTIGNRRVGGVEVPSDSMLTELFAERGVEFVTAVDRRIPAKRMATRNNVASTMRSERILIFRQGRSSADA